MQIPASASGGTPQQVTRLDISKGEISHRWPHILPGGKALLFTIWTGPGWDEQAIAVRLLNSGEQRIVVKGGTCAKYVPSGHLVYSHADQLMAVPFNPDTLQVIGGPAVPLNEKVMDTGEGTDLAFSQAGLLAYIQPSEEQDTRQFAWVDRNGRMETLPAPPRNYQMIRLSPDGPQILATIQGPSTGIWIYDLSSSGLRLLTSEEGSSQCAIWTQDGKRAIYRGTRAGSRHLYWKAVDGSGREEQLTKGEAPNNIPFAMSPDGKYVVYSPSSEKNGTDLLRLDMEAERKSEDILTSTHNEFSAAISPDGRFLAYISDESGRNEIYVQPFPGPGGRVQVSTEGGIDPVWNPNKNVRELFYRHGDKMISVNLSLLPTLKPAPPRQLFEVKNVKSSVIQGYDISPDGSRFLMIKTNPKEETASQIQIVLNWFDELKRLVPSGRK